MTAARVRYEFALDTPLPIRAAEGVVRIKGWCFTPHGPTQPQVQLRIGAVTLTAPIDGERSDVGAAFPTAPHARRAGFEISGHVPAGLTTAELWAGRDGFGWEHLLSFSLFAEAAVLHGAIDLPTDREITENRSIDGWCFHPQREIAEIWLHYGIRQVRCRHYGHTRSDVEKQFPHLPQAARCGFSSEGVLLPGEGRVRLRAVDRDGGVYFCETDRHIRIAPPRYGAVSTDPRLDGKALFRAVSARLNELPPLRVLAPADAALVGAAAEALAELPGDRWQIIVATGGKPAKELTPLASGSARVRLDAPADPKAWTLALQGGERPDIHGLMAAWLAATDHPGLTAICGDFSLGANHEVQAQPPWSPELVFGGAIDPQAPLLCAPGTDASTATVGALARARARVAHIAASLVHRASANPGARRPTAPTPAASFKRPPVNGFFLGSETELAEVRSAFGDEVDDWDCLGAQPRTTTLAAALAKAKGALAFVAVPGMRPASAQPLKRLAFHLGEGGAALAAPLLLRADSAPWSPADALDARTRQTFAAFDPAFAAWKDPHLALYLRATPYPAIPGLLIARAALESAGGLDAAFDTAAGALLDLSFRLRTAGSPAILAPDARMFADPAPLSLPPFEEALLLDRWDQDDFNPLRIRPLVPVEVLA